MFISAVRAESFGTIQQNQSVEGINHRRTQHSIKFNPTKRTRGESIGLPPTAP